MKPQRPIRGPFRFIRKFFERVKEMQFTASSTITQLPDTTPDGYPIARARGVLIQNLSSNVEKIYVGFQSTLSNTGTSGGIEVVPGNSIFIDSRRLEEGALPYIKCAPTKTAVVAWDVI